MNPVTGWLHVSVCTGRCCQQSVCDYRWTLDSWPVLLTHPARPCSASCRGLTSESRGDYSDSDRVLRSLSQSSRLRPSTSGPDLCTGSWLGAEIYRILCWQEGLSLLLSIGDCGKSSFSMKHNCFRVQDEGERCQLRIQYNLGHSEVEEQREY